MKLQEKRIEELLISLVDHWNENHFGQKLDKDLIIEIRDHLEQGYVCGMEDAFRMINKEFEKYKANTKTSTILMKNIINLRTYEL